MKLTLKIFIVIIFFANVQNVFSQHLVEKWVSTISQLPPPSWEVILKAIDITTDNSGNIYVLALKQIHFPDPVDDTTYSTIIKYNQSGQILWTVDNSFGAYNVFDISPQKIKTDNAGHIYITGGIENPDTAFVYKIITAKYNEDGNLLWAVKSNFNVANVGIGGTRFGLCLDDKENILILGGNNIIKYNSNGIFQWSALLPNSGNYNRALCLDINNDIIITGWYGTYKYTSNGVAIWFIPNPPQIPCPQITADTRIEDVISDNEGNILITGGLYNGCVFEYDVIIRKYSASGNVLWTKINPMIGNQEGSNLILDHLNNIYISKGTPSLKYNTSGELLWTSNAYGINGSLDGIGNIYFCAGAPKPIGNQTLIRTYKVNIYNGNITDSISFNPSSGSKIPTASSLYNANNIYVLGYSSSGDPTMYTVKYSMDTFYVPSAPLNLIYNVPEIGRVKLSWTDTSNNEAFFKIQRKDSISNVWSDIDSVYYDITQYTDANVIVGRSYWYRVYAKNLMGNSPYSNEVFVSLTSNSNNNNIIPSEYSLYQNYPNPFNPVTQIKYDLPKASLVKIKIYDIQGKLVTELINNFQQSGTYEIDWNAINYSSGIYFYKLEAGEFQQVNKMILLK